MSSGSAGESPPGGEARHCWTAGSEAAGRLDSYVAARLGLSRSRVAALIGEGRVLVDGRAAKKSEAVAEGRVVEVAVPAPAPSEAEPEDIAMDIVFEDRDLVVVNKQAGLVVHPAPGHPRGTLVNALLHHVGDLSGIGGTLRPGIVHRLDRDTSGLMVVAKSDRAHRGLSDALRARRVKRVYLAALWGALGEREVLVDRPIGRHPRDRTRMAVVAGGRPSRTRLPPPGGLACRFALRGRARHREDPPDPGACRGDRASGGGGRGVRRRAGTGVRGGGPAVGRGAGRACGAAVFACANGWGSSTRSRGRR